MGAFPLYVELLFFMLSSLFTLHSWLPEAYRLRCWLQLLGLPLLHLPMTSGSVRCLTNVRLYVTCTAISHLSVHCFTNVPQCVPCMAISHLSVHCITNVPQGVPCTAISWLCALSDQCAAVCTLYCD